MLAVLKSLSASQLVVGGAAAGVLGIAVLLIAFGQPEPGQPAPGAPGVARAWIDRPLNATVLPLAPMTVMAHATDMGGVQAVELLVDGETAATDSY